MRFLSYEQNGRAGLAVNSGNGFRGYRQGDPEYPGNLQELLGRTADLAGVARLLSQGSRLNLVDINFRPPVARPGKIICLGLNYTDHSQELGYERPVLPALFGRFSNCLIGHGEPLIRPRKVKQFDYEGELALVMGKQGHRISPKAALEHVAGYTIFNDATARDLQFVTTQWTMSKNFDATGACGPWLVTPEELPPGAKGLDLITRLNGQVVQEGNTADLLFAVPEIIAVLSEIMTLEPGDLVVTGTPGGVGYSRNPPLFMEPGDFCEIEIEGLGVLSNSVVDEGS